MAKLSTADIYAALKKIGSGADPEEVLLHLIFSSQSDNAIKGLRLLQDGSANTMVIRDRLKLKPSTATTVMHRLEDLGLVRSSGNRVGGYFLIWELPERVEQHLETWNDTKT